MDKIILFQNRFWTVVNYDDTSGKWICQDGEGFLRYFSKEEIEENEIKARAGI